MSFDKQGNAEGLPSQIKYILSGAAFNPKGLIIFSSVLWSISITLIILRTAYRRFSGVKLHKDDIAMIVEGVLVTAFQCIVIVVGRIGHKNNQLALHDSNGDTILFYVWLGAILFLLSSATLKIALVLYWIRLCMIIGNRLYKTTLFLKVLLWFIVVLNAISLPAVIFTCWPIDTYWKSKVYAANPHTCIDRDARFVVRNSINAGINIVIVLAPLPLIRVCSGGSIRWQKKVALGFLYGLGLVLVFTSLMPIISLKVIGITYLDPTIPISANFGIIVWTIIEAQLGPIVACIPTLMPFYHDMSRRCSRITSKIMRKRGDSSVTFDTESTAPMVDLAPQEQQRQSTMSCLAPSEETVGYMPPSPGQRTMASSTGHEEHDRSPRINPYRLTLTPSSPSTINSPRLSRMGATAKTLDPELVEKWKSIVYEA